MTGIEHGHRFARRVEKALRREFSEPFDVTYDDARREYRIGLGPALVTAGERAMEDARALTQACRVMASDQLEAQMGLEAKDG